MTPPADPPPSDGAAAAGDRPGDLPGFLVGIGNFMFKHRNYLFPLAFFIVVLGDRPRRVVAGPGEWGVDALGVLLAVAGQTLRAAVLGWAHIARGGKDGKVHADALVRHGVYAYSRNPLYVGNFLVFLGIFLVLNSLAGWLIGLPLVMLSYLAIVAAEEKFLRGQFGPPYDEFRRRVPRFLSFRRWSREPFDGLRFDWKRVIRMEYAPTFVWTTAILVILVWQRVANGDAEGARADWPVYAVVWAVILLGYGTARFLKKTGRLRD